MGSIGWLEIRHSGNKSSVNFSSLIPCLATYFRKLVFFYWMNGL